MPQGRKILDSGEKVLGLDSGLTRFGVQGLEALQAVRPHTRVIRPHAQLHVFFFRYVKGRKSRLSQDAGARIIEGASSRVLHILTLDLAHAAIRLDLSSRFWELKKIRLRVRVKGFGFKVQGKGIRIWGLGCRV